MNRIDRLHAIVTILQSKRVVKAEELATRFEISLRTVYRDIRALEEGGIPIGAEAGVGYFLTEGYYLPPVMFTKEEARALLIAGKFMDKTTDQATSRHFKDALTKVRAVLKEENKDELEGLDNKILVNPFSSFKPVPEDLKLGKIKEALSETRVVKIIYHSAGTGEMSEREIEPMGIVYYTARWHLIGYCRLRKDYRDFRLDRIEKLEVLPERFLMVKHPSLKDHLEKLISTNELITVSIKLPVEVLRFIQDSKYNMGLIKEEQQDEMVQLTFATFSIDYFARWLLMMGDSPEIVSPAELKVKTRELVQKLYGKYNG